MTDEYNWRTFYEGLDPDGKKFAQQIQLLHQVATDLPHFLFEGSQLYGIVIHLMVDKLGIYDLEIPVEYFKTLNGWGLVTTPSEDGDSSRATSGRWLGLRTDASRSAQRRGLA